MHASGASPVLSSRERGKSILVCVRNQTALRLCSFGLQMDLQELALSLFLNVCIVTDHQEDSLLRTKCYTVQLEEGLNF